jgi:hypothetical protein
MVIYLPLLIFRFCFLISGMFALIRATHAMLAANSTILYPGMTASKVFLNAILVCNERSVSGEGSDPIPAPPDSWIPPNESSYNTWPAVYINLQTMDFCASQFDHISQRIHCIEQIGTGPVLP